MKKDENVANKAGITKKDTLIVLDAILETLQECLVKKESMTFVGFRTYQSNKIGFS